MTRSELIRLIGDVLTQMDVLRSERTPGSSDRDRLDELRDDLDEYQRELVSALIDENTPGFNDLTASLRVINAELNQTIDDLAELAETLEALVNFVGVVQKIVELIP